MMTRDFINRYFTALVSVPDGNILSNKGFTALADWSERQTWWPEFALSHSLKTDWRVSPMGDPYLFSLSLFRFFVHQHGDVTIPPCHH
ncbi:MAG TPA: hypothetical protein VIH45_06040 [Desulfuromonadaceae bacterium]